MSPYTAAAGQFGDTTYTKIFVGGLAWETQKDSMRNYFEQFGEILEAVVITDKNSGRSKGYGFVTFREADAARRACVDPSPVIDGRKTNCNLASLGLQKSRPATPLHGGSKNFRNMKSFQGAGMQGGMETALPSLATFPHYAIHQGIPYNVYGYSLYPTEYAYPANYYNIHGEAANQYQVYGGATTGTISGANAFYPYFQFGQGYRVQQPQILQYSSGAAVAGVTGFAVSQQYGRPISVAPTAAVQAGMTVDPTAPNQSTPSTMAHHYRLIPTHFNATPILEQPLA